jgi:hypothetical protein
VEPLDLDRAFGRGRTPLAAQSAKPSAGDAGLGAKLVAQRVERRKFSF